MRAAVLGIVLGLAAFVWGCYLEIQGAASEQEQFMQECLQDHNKHYECVALWRASI